MASGDTLRLEIEESKNDQFGNKTKVVKCHGKLVSESTNQLRETVKPLLPEGGRIVIDLSDVDHLDSSGLGALVSLKASAVKQVFAFWKSPMSRRASCSFSALPSW